MTFRLPVQVAIAIATFLTVGAAAVLISQLPGIGAGALLFPSRHLSRLPPPAECLEREFAGAAGRLAGWHCRARNEPSKATVVYLHGIGDNRDSSVGIIRRFVPQGYDVVAYDGRAHGRSEGDRCTYGYYEKDDVRRVVDQVGATNVVLIGNSLGAAVALQAAPIEPRTRAVIAVSTFSDLRTIATERAAVAFFPSFAIERAFDRTERDGRFTIDDASPLKAAATIRVPVFLVHGEDDHNTSPAHSRRVFDALQDRKRLLIVPRAGHNDVLRDEVWGEIERWMDSVVRTNRPEIH